LIRTLNFDSMSLRTLPEILLEVKASGGESGNRQRNSKTKVSPDYAPPLYRSIELRKDDTQSGV